MVGANFARLRNARSHVLTPSSDERGAGASELRPFAPRSDRISAVKVSDFEYELPSELIAQRPATPRDGARLLVHGIGADRTQHLHVRDLPSVLSPGDLLIVNDTRVRAARLS